MATYRIPIRNSRPNTWLNWIERGEKTWEGRLYRGTFARIRVGDTIVFHDRFKEVTTCVTDLRRYASFGEAFNVHGHQMVPIPGITTAEVAQMYLEFFSQEDIREHGVIMIGVRVC